MGERLAVIDRDGVGNWARHRSSATGTVVLGIDSMELFQGGKYSRYYDCIDYYRLLYTTQLIRTFNMQSTSANCHPPTRRITPEPKNTREALLETGGAKS